MENLLPHYLFLLLFWQWIDIWKTIIAIVTAEVEGLFFAWILAFVGMMTYEMKLKFLDSIFDN